VESLVPGAVARHVALRHGLHPNQLYMWRREHGRDGREGGEAAGFDFVPVALSRSEAGRGSAPACLIEIEIAGAVVRVSPGVEVGFLRTVLGAVKGA
jgi:transposase